MDCWQHSQHVLGQPEIRCDSTSAWNIVHQRCNVHACLIWFVVFQIYWFQCESLGFAFTPGSRSSCKGPAWNGVAPSSWVQWPRSVPTQGLGITPGSFRRTSQEKTHRGNVWIQRAGINQQRLLTYHRIFQDHHRTEKWTTLYWLCLPNLLLLRQFSWHQRVPDACPHMLYIWRRPGTYQQLSTLLLPNTFPSCLAHKWLSFNAVIWSVFQLTEIWGILLLQANQRSLGETRTPQSIPEKGWVHIGFYQRAPCLQTWVQSNKITAQNTGIFGLCLRFGAGGSCCLWQGAGMRTLEFADGNKIACCLGTDAHSTAPGSCFFLRVGFSVKKGALSLMQTVPTGWTSKEDFNKPLEIAGVRVPSASLKMQQPTLTNEFVVSSAPNGEEVNANSFCRAKAAQSCHQQAEFGASHPNATGFGWTVGANLLHVLRPHSTASIQSCCPETQSWLVPTMANQWGNR